MPPRMVKTTATCGRRSSIISPRTSVRGAMNSQHGSTTAGRSKPSDEVAALKRLFTYAAWADKYDGRSTVSRSRGVALAMKEPVGVIGALCPAEAPLLGLISAWHRPLRWATA